MRQLSVGWQAASAGLRTEQPRAMPGILSVVSN